MPTDATKKPRRRHPIRRLVIVGLLGALIQRWLRPGQGGPGSTPRSGGSWPPVRRAPGQPGPPT